MRKCSLLFTVLPLVAGAPVPAQTTPTDAPSHLAFDFGPGSVAPGWTPVTAETRFDEATGYGLHGGAATGIDRGGDALTGDLLTGDAPFLFSVRLPDEGNYRVRVTLGDPGAESTTTLKAELRRLMIEQAAVAAGQRAEREFVVNVRTPAIPGSGEVRVKPRERTDEIAAWDDRLTLEINGERPAIAAIEIERDDRVPTLYLIGDSTVCDQPAEPWTSWGQMLPRFFGPTIAIANHAQSGESIRSSLGARRFDKIYAHLRAGDFLMLQFGHNDMKATAPNAIDQYEADLRDIVRNVRERGATPLLVTPMERRTGIETETLAGYPDRVRRVAAEEKVALIDLHALSRRFYRALDDELDAAFVDGTHHNGYGSYQLAWAIADAIRDGIPELAGHLADDFGNWDPDHPTPPAAFRVPPSPQVSNIASPGN